MKSAVSVYYGMPVLLNYALQGITFHLRNQGQERLFIVATFWCLSLFQRMAKLWPEGPFIRVRRLTLTAILRIKCNLNCKSVSTRMLIGQSESVLLFSLPSYIFDAFLQMLATPWVVSGLFLAQLSHFPSSHLLWSPIKGKNHSASSITCFTCLEVPRSLGETWCIYTACHWAVLPSGGCCAGMQGECSMLQSLPIQSSSREVAERWARQALPLPESLSLLCACPREYHALSLWAQGELYRREQTRATICLQPLNMPWPLWNNVCVRVCTVITPKVSSPVIWLLVSQQGFLVMDSVHTTLLFIVLSYVTSSFPVLHANNESPQQCVGLHFMELPWRWCKVCSLSGQDYAHTEGAELASSAGSWRFQASQNLGCCFPGSCFSLL